MKIFVSLGEHERETYEKGLSARIDPAKHQLVTREEDAEFLVFSPDSRIRDFAKLPNLKFVQSIWAGVDSIVQNETLVVPLARLVDAGLSEGMREYVMGHILADHIEIRRFERATRWEDQWLPLARNRTVGIVGIGTLGQSVANAAMALGFRVLGWSQSEKSLDFPTFQGANGLSSLLEQSDYVVTLLPNTPETYDLINAEFLAKMKSTAMLINPGRGALLDETALLDALDKNQIRRAVLDVFKTEPLPADHPFWNNDKILITPHIAAKSRPETAIDVILENLERVSNGQEPKFLVDRKTGY